MACPDGAAGAAADLPCVDCNAGNTHQLPGLFEPTGRHTIHTPSSPCANTPFVSYLRITGAPVAQVWSPAAASPRDWLFGHSAVAANLLRLHRTARLEGIGSCPRKSCRSSAPRAVSLSHRSSCPTLSGSGTLSQRDFGGKLGPEVLRLTGKVTGGIASILARFLRLIFALSALWWQEESREIEALSRFGTAGHESCVEPWHSQSLAAPVSCEKFER